MRHSTQVSLTRLQIHPTMNERDDTAPRIGMTLQVFEPDTTISEERCIQTLFQYHDCNLNMLS